jgi:hypothetical protein
MEVDAQYRAVVVDPFARKPAGFLPPGFLLVTDGRRLYKAAATRPSSIG